MGDTFLNIEELFPPFPQDCDQVDPLATSAQQAPQIPSTSFTTTTMSVECEDCGAVFDTKKQLQSHRNIKHRKKPCRYCRKEISVTTHARHEKSCRNHRQIVENDEDQEMDTGEAQQPTLVLPPMDRIFLNHGMSHTQFHYVEPVFKEMGVDFLKDDDTMIVVNWTEQDWQTFVDKVGAKPMEKLAVIIPNVFSTINGFRKLLDVPLPDVNLPVAPVCLSSSLRLD